MRFQLKEEENDISILKGNRIGLKTEYADSKTTYRLDGYTEQVEQGFVKKETWKFLLNQSQIQIKPEKVELRLYIIDLLSETNLNVRATFKKLILEMMIFGSHTWKL